MLVGDTGCWGEGAMAETEEPSIGDDPALEITERFSEAGRALFSAGSVADTLQRVVDLAVEIIEGCDFAGIFLLDGDAVTTPVDTDPLVIEVDALQHRLGEGPCLDALTDGGELYADDWPAMAAGPGSGRRPQLPVSVPSWRSPCPATAPTVPSTCTPATGRPSGSSTGPRGSLLSGLAGLALASAAAHDDNERRLDNLQAALATRLVIGQAQGILIEREGITPDQSFDVLRRASQHLNIKLRDVAQALVDTGEQPQTGSPPTS